MRDRQCALNHDAIESAPIVQEHWLPSFDLHRLHNIVSDNVCFASSAMDDGGGASPRTVCVVALLAVWQYL